MEDEKICLKCHQIVIGKHWKCCGEVVPFSEKEHARHLIANSNSWIHIWKEVEKHPLLKEISNKLADEGCYSASVCIGELIALLQKRVGELEELNKIRLAANADFLENALKTAEENVFLKARAEAAEAEVKALKADRENWLDTAGRNGRRVVQLEADLSAMREGREKDREFVTEKMRNLHAALSTCQKRLAEAQKSQHDENCDSLDILIPNKPCNCYLLYKKQLAEKTERLRGVEEYINSDEAPDWLRDVWQAIKKATEGEG